MNDGYSKQSLLSISSRPAERKSCKICKTFIYFHQPILLCTSCCNVFHGICLKYSNDLVFNLQLILWHCSDCFDSENHRLYCEYCFADIDIEREKFKLCRHCRKPVHMLCMRDEVCMKCCPLAENSLNIENVANIDILEIDRYFNGLPIFNPFEFYERKIVDFIPDVDSLSDSIQNCSFLLNSCRYLKSEKSAVLSRDNIQYSSLIGLNIDGVRTNFDQFQVFASKVDTRLSDNVIGYFLCETNVTANESDTFYLDKFNKFTLDRIRNKNNKLKHKGSGLMIFLTQKLYNVKVCAELNVSTLDFECLAVEVEQSNIKLLLICVYRSPSGNFDNFIVLLDEVLSNANKRREFKTFLLGDFNVNLLNPKSSNCTNYLSCIFSNGYFPVISRPTHFTGLNPTCIDHILCNDLSDAISSGIFRDKISHHLPIFLSLDLKLCNNVKDIQKPRIRINEFTLGNFCKELDEIDQSLNLDETAETCFSSFIRQFRLSYDKWFINQTASVNKKFVNLRKDWITIGIAKSCRVREELYGNWFHCKTLSNWNTYHKYSRKLDSMIEKVKFDYLKKKLDDNIHDLKKTWRLINSILGRKRQNKLLTFPGEDASHNFNKYFVSVANDLLRNNYSNKVPDESFMNYLNESKGHQNGIFTPLENCTFEPAEIRKLISELNNSKCTYFSPRVLKSVSYSLAPILSKLFNKCTASGYFPNELKVAKIIPLFKNKGSVNDMCNYRPISMLSVFSKLFEKLIHKVISEFLDENDLLNESQYGFRKRRSTLHALLNATENIYQASDSKLNTLGIFIDFSRAFDTVNHSILLKKLNYYGIKGQILQLLTSYLSDRKQYVSYGGRESTLLEVDIGVPQGSVLGPLLFIIFINDIINITQLAKCVLFADDCNLFVTHTSREALYRIANQILHELYQYCCSNRLIINYGKCCFIEFGSASKSEGRNSYFLGILNSKFEQVEKCKFLGVIINEHLNWNDQLEHVIMQVAKSCGTLYRVRLQVPRKILKQIYTALVQPYLNYCISLWGSSLTSKSMNKLFVLQKKCIRIVTGKTTKENGMFRHTKPMFQSLNVLTVFNLYVYFTASELKKILNTDSPKNLSEFFTVSAHSGRIIFPKFNLEFFKSKSFVFNGSRILNYFLQQDIPFTGISHSVFKTRVKRHLLTIQSQSVAGDSSWLPCNHNIFSDVQI